MALIAVISVLVGLMFYYLYHRTDCINRDLGKDELAGIPGWQSTVEWDRINQRFIYEHEGASYLGLGFYTFQEVYCANLYLDKTLHVHFCFSEIGLNSMSARLYENATRSVEIYFNVGGNSGFIAEKDGSDNSINIQKLSLSEFMKTGAIEGRTTTCSQTVRRVFEIAMETGKGLKTRPVFGWRPKFLFPQRRDVQVTHLTDPFLEAETKAFSRIKALTADKSFFECYKYDGPALPEN